MITRLLLYCKLFVKCYSDNSKQLNNHFTLQGILAEDMETDGSATVMYHLQDQPHPLFSINETTGIVTVNGTIDRETNESFVLIIVAYEEG